MIIKEELVQLVLFWFIISIIIIIVNWRKNTVSVGLAVIYLANLTLLHGIAPSLYLLPWQEFGTDEWLLLGFREAVYGLFYFALGNLILAPFIINFIAPLAAYKNTKKSYSAVDKLGSQSKIPTLYFLLGTIAYFFSEPWSAIPTVNAIASMSEHLLVIGIALNCWYAYQQGNRKRLVRWLLMIPLLPILSILTRGLMGIGAMMAFAVLLFLARFIRAKLKTIIIGMIVGYISLSFYVTYMRDRPQLRGVIWSRAPAMDRIMALQKTFFEPEWFNPFNFTHLATVDERINQNILVGMAVEHLKTGSIDYARGYTIYESVLALFPRILWPEKNVYAGSGDIVSKYTGLTFYGATSVGVGEVMEFYINFGRTGVMIGFLIIGILIKMADLLCGYALLKEDSMVFILWFLVGISLSGGVGGSLVEVTASCGASIVVAHLVAQIKVKYYYYLLFSFVLYIILRFIFLSI